MKNIHENEIKKQRTNLIRSRMILNGVSMRKWAFAHNYNYTTVNAVILGHAGKLSKPDTISGQIQLALQAEGYWPVDEEQP